MHAGRQTGSRREYALERAGGFGVNFKTYTMSRYIDRGRGEPELLSLG